jgi:hypothetical protein
MIISSKTTRAEIDAICERHERHLDELQEYQETSRQRKKDRLDIHDHNALETRQFITSRRSAHD